MLPDSYQNKKKIPKFNRKEFQHFRSLRVGTIGHSGCSTSVIYFFYEIKFVSDSENKYHIMLICTFVHITKTWKLNRGFILLTPTGTNGFTQRKGRQHDSLNGIEIQICVCVFVCVNCGGSVGWRSGLMPWSSQGDRVVVGWPLLRRKSEIHSHILMMFSFAVKHLNMSASQ